MFVAVPSNDVGIKLKTVSRNVPTVEETSLVSLNGGRVGNLNDALVVEVVGGVVLVVGGTPSKLKAMLSTRCTSIPRG